MLAKSNISVGCFVVIGFPEDNLKSMLATYRMIFKLAIIGVDDITVSQFTPYPGSYYYDVLLEKGLLKGRIEEMSDIISYYSQRTRSYSETLSPKSIYYFMMSMFIFFYVFSFILRPWKPILNVIQYFKTGSENARYVKFLSEIFIVRKKWFTNLVNSPPKR